MKIQEKETQKNIKDMVDKKIQKQFEDFQKSIKNETEQKKITEAFNKNSKPILEAIQNSIINNFITIDDKKLQTYTQATDAFEQDIKTLGINNSELNTIIDNIQNRIDLKQIDKITDLTRLEELKIFAIKEGTIVNGSSISVTANASAIEKILPAINKKITTITSEKKKTEAQTVRNLLTLNYDTQESAKRFFETSNEEDFKLAMNQAYTEAGGTTENENTTQVNIENTNSLRKIMEKYAGTTDIKDVKLGKSNDDYATAYVDGTRVIEAKIGTTLTEDNPSTTINGILYTLKDETITPNLETGTGIEINKNTIYQTKYIAWGDQQEMQKQKAKNTEKIKDFANMRDKTKELNVFDDGGNYEAFRLFLDTKDATFVQDNLATIIEQIKTYKPIDGKADAGENINDLKNGYATVLNDYITNPEHYTNDLLMTYIDYLDYLDTTNMNILGVDKLTRVINFNKITKAWNNHKEEIKENRGEEKAKEYAQKVLDIGKIIAEQKNTSTMDILKNGLDIMKKTFGPLLLSILKYFGIGKRTLTNRFGKEAEEMYAEEFGWKDQEKINAAINLADTFTPDAITDTKGNLVKLEKGADIKTEFTAEDRTNYIKNLTENPGYYKYININVLQQGLDAYNKKNKTTLNIHDIVTIEKNTTTGKDEITATKGDKIKIQDILAIMLDNDDLRSSIANAQAEIGTPVKDEKVTGRVNEHGMTQEDAVRYKIQSKNDIARYITASLFSDKDLAYTMTENNLHNGAKITNKPNDDSESVPTPQETLKFVDDMYDTTTGVTAAGAKKMIHEVVDMNNAPEKIKVTNGTTETIAVKKEITVGTDKIITYISKNKTGLTIDDRVKIYEGNKIEAVQSPEYLYQENNKAITDALKNITNTNTNKYKNFDFTTAFTYEKTTADADKKDYQDNLLTPISSILTDQEQFTLLFTDDKINDKLTAIGPIHLKNTFTMMDAPNETKSYENVTTKIKDQVTSIEAKDNVITITQDNGAITIGYNTTGKLTPERTAKQTS